MSPLNVFYLDDEIDLCEVFAELYRSPLVQITTFTSAEDFVAAVRAEAPDLAFVDYLLPGTTGDVVCAELPTSFPKILVTGEIQLAAVEGFERVLRKPTLFNEVSEVIAHFAAPKAG